MHKKLLKWLGLKLASLVRYADTELDRRRLPQLANTPRNLFIQSPSRIINSTFITIGDDVSLGPGCMLNAIRQYPGSFLSGLPKQTQIQKFEPAIRIGDRVSATGYLSIGAVESVTIGNDVIFASYIFISDHSHGRSRVDIPYKYQPLTDVSPVVIGRGCWISEHVVVMPGVSIGEYSIVGANSVVTTNIPARSIAVGSPARVIKEWSESKAGWISVSGPD